MISSLVKPFTLWLQHLPALSQVQIPRWLNIISEKKTEKLFTFFETQTNKFMQMWTENVSEIRVQLESARSRVAPLQNSKTILWNDPSTALTWIKSEEQWGTFVYNRVKGIRTLTESSTWRFVPGKMNAADLHSRGCTVEHLMKLKWWESPEWLKQYPED